MTTNTQGWRWWTETPYKLSRKTGPESGSRREIVTYRCVVRLPGQGGNAYTSPEYGSADEAKSNACQWALANLGAQMPS